MRDFCWFYYFYSCHAAASANQAHILYVLEEAKREGNYRSVPGHRKLADRNCRLDFRNLLK